MAHTVQYSVSLGPFSVLRIRISSSLEVDALYFFYARLEEAF